MDERTRRALERDRTIDITTTGRASGQLYRIEMWFHNVDGHLYITGTPGRRSWHANLAAHPEFTFHLKESVRADLPARGIPILETTERRMILARILESLGHPGDLEAWVRESPLVEVTLVEERPAGRRERR